LDLAIFQTINFPPDFQKLSQVAAEVDVWRWKWNCH